MKKAATILLALSILLVLWANGASHYRQLPKRPPGNIPDGMYSIVGESSHRCLEVPNASCRSEEVLQTLDCDPTDNSNNQKFNIVADGSGYYTISPVHSDQCLEVPGGKEAGRTPVLQNECSPNKDSQKWSMSQYGVNLEIRAAESNQCIDIMGRSAKNYGRAYLHECSNGTNQRWRLTKKTLSLDGVICRASPSHPDRECYGTNDQQQKVFLGKTVTKARCEDACRASKMTTCKWG